MKIVKVPLLLLAVVGLVFSFTLASAVSAEELTE
jgi:hypothetical protein